MKSVYTGTIIQYLAQSLYHRNKINVIIYDYHPHMIIGMQVPNYCI